MLTAHQLLLGWCLDFKTLYCSRNQVICYQLGETVANRVPASRDRVMGWFSVVQEGLRMRRAMRAMVLRAKTAIGT